MKKRTVSFKSLNSLDNSSKQLKASLKLIYGINDLEFEVVDFLLSEQNFACINAMESNLKRPRSTIQRCLGKLMENRLISRTKVSLAEFAEICTTKGQDDYIPSTDRGYRFLYKAVPKEKLKEQLLRDSKSGFDLIEQAIQGL